MSHYTVRHIELVEAVNNARTQADHEAALAHLKGFRAALSGMDIHPAWLLADADCHYAAQGITSPMEGGVWLDCEPGTP